MRGDVVEEEERLGARRQHVVDAVGGEIGAAVAQAAGLPGEHELRPDAVGRGGEQPPLVEREEAREASEHARQPPPSASTRGRREAAPRPPRPSRERLRHRSYVRSSLCTYPIRASGRAVQCRRGEVRRAADPFDLLSMLTVQDIVALPALGLRVAAGAAGLAERRPLAPRLRARRPDAVARAAASSSCRPGSGSAPTRPSRSAYIGRLAEHRLAGLGFGLGFGHETVPTPLVEEADRQSFPIFEVPYEVPFIAISKAVFTHLASEQLELVTQALEVHERLAQAVTHGRGAAGAARRPRKPPRAAASRSWTRADACWRSATHDGAVASRARSSCRSSPTTRWRR